MARRFYRRAAQPVRTTPAYWEIETPTGGPNGMQIGNYVIKHYPGAGKIQTFNTYHCALTKGVTASLDLMTAAELDAFRDLFNAAIEAEKQRRVAAAPAPSAIQPDPAQPAQPANNPAAFKALLASVLAKTSATAV